MKNGITADDFNWHIVPTEDQTADLIRALLHDRDLWRDQATETVLFVAERKEQIDALKRVNAEQLTRIEELSDQLDDMRLTFEQDRLSWFASAMKHKDKIRELEAENQKLRGAVVQEPIPWVSGHVCSRECAHD